MGSIPEREPEKVIVKQQLAKGERDMDDIPPLLLFEFIGQAAMKELPASR